MPDEVNEKQTTPQSGVPEGHTIENLDEESRGVVNDIMSEIQATGEKTEAKVDEKIQKEKENLENLVQAEAKALREEGEEDKEAQDARNRRIEDAVVSLQGTVQQYIENQIGSSINGMVSHKEAVAQDKARREQIILNRPEVARANAKYMEAYCAYFSPTTRATVDLLKVQKLGLDAERAYADAASQFGITAATGEIVTDVPDEGGLLVPRPMRQSIIERSMRMGGVRELAEFVDTPQGSGNTLTFPVQSGYAEAKFLGTRDGNISNTEAPANAEVTIPLNKAMAKVKVEKDYWSDAPMYALNFYNRQLYQGLIDIEDKMFVEGNDPKSPKGVLSYTLSDVSDTHPFNQIQRVKSGVDGGFPTPGAGKSQAKPLIEAIGAIWQNKRNMGAGWVMSRQTATAVRNLTDGDGNLVWQSGLVNGAPNMLLGFPIYEDDWMPELGANSNSILFMVRGSYVITTRSSEGTVVIRDVINDDNYDTVKIIRRCGGAIVDHWALSVVRFES